MPSFLKSIDTACPLKESKDGEMSKEEKKWDLKPIAKRERELKSWVGLRRPFCFPCFFFAGLQLLCCCFFYACYRMHHHKANNFGLLVVVHSMNETRSVNKIFEGKLDGRRGRGRPRLRWIDNVEDDLRKLGVKRWRAKELDREEWASIIREAKAKLKGP